MQSSFLERDQAMNVLHSAIAKASAGVGSNVLISGEAGIGKSTLVDQFVKLRRDRCQILIGGCETLTTPRPLGPLCDVASLLGDAFQRLFHEEASPARIFQELVVALSRSTQPTILVFEDVHWADYATLDLIKFLSRRSAQLPLVFVMTYRLEEVSRSHPLRAVLGDMPIEASSRINLLPLSRGAVDEICRRAEVKHATLFEVTLGNPFLVSVFVDAAQRPQTNPLASIRDVVQARISRLSEDSQRLCELVSVVPGSVEISVLQTACESLISSNFIDSVDQCLISGLLELHDKTIGFKHEISRRVVETNLQPVTTKILNDAVYQALLAVPDVSFARLVHHASKAQLHSQVATLAPQAADQARRLGARLEALTNYRHALDFLDLLPTKTQAEVLEGWAVETAAMTWPDQRVFEALHRAVSLWKSLGETERAGGALRWLAFGFWIFGKRKEGTKFLEEALSLLESIPPTATLAVTYSLRIKLYMADSDYPQAIATGQRALSISQSLKAEEAMAQSMTYLGTAMLRAQQLEGKKLLVDGIALGREKGYFKSTSDAYHNLVEALLKQGMLLEAEQSCAEGLNYSGQFDISTTYLYGLESQIQCQRGRYDQAEKTARKAIETLPGGSDFVRRPALTGLGIALSRAGRDGALETLRELLNCNINLDFTQDILPATAALTEALAFAGKFEEAREVLTKGWGLRGRESNPWMIGALLIWAERLNLTLHGDHAADISLAKPFEFELKGQHRAAADCWGAIGAPFEQAVALMRCEPSDVLRAIDIFDEISAAPALNYARMHAKALGLRGVKRGPYGASRGNPVGLTAREMQILQLICSGLSNSLIATKLQRSERTIEHHVSSILSKAGANTRSALMAWAFRAQIVRQ